MKVKRKYIIPMLYDLLLTYDYLYWKTDIGNAKAQEIVDNMHKGKYDKMCGCYVQWGEVIKEVKKVLLENGDINE